MSDLSANQNREPRHVESYDPADFHSVSNAVVEAIATVTDTSPLELDPLHETVSLEAVERFVEHATCSPHEPAVVVGFTVEAWDVFVHGDGRIEVYDSDRTVADAVDGSADRRESARCD